MWRVPNFDRFHWRRGQPAGTIPPYSLATQPEFDFSTAQAFSFTECSPSCGKFPFGRDG
jgi:hypothetical protein